MVCAALVALVLPGAAGAAIPPSHPPLGPAVEGLNRACGVAVDSHGDVYVASAASSRIYVFAPEHLQLGEQIAEISNANEPCGLAVNGQGHLFVSEKAVGMVVRYKPNPYPLGSSPTYGSAEAIDESGFAKGIGVDPVDERLYVAEGTRIAVYRYDGSFEAHIGEGSLSEATGVATYTYVFFSNALEQSGFRYIYAADRSGNKLKLFAGEVRKESGTLKVATSLAAPTLRREISGPKAGESFDFGAAGAYLAIDPGNRGAEEKCLQIAEQACTAGHLLVYDHAHQAVDELDASGEFLDRIEDPEMSDAEPSGMAVDRSGGPNDGSIYVSSGAGTGAKVLAFKHLVAPGRPPLGQGEPVQGRPPKAPSQVLRTATAAAVDSHGDLYVATAAAVHVFSPTGVPLTEFTDGEHPYGVAVDSKGNVYTIDEGPAIGTERVTYYVPSSYPPSSATTYSRHEPPLATEGAGWPPACERLKAITVNPANDHLFIAAGCVVHELGSVEEGSSLLNSGFASGIAELQTILKGGGIGVCGKSGEVFLSGDNNHGEITVLDATGTRVLARITGAGSPAGLLPGNPHIAVDQANCHVLAFDPEDPAAREYDARGGFLAEFGQFSSSGPYGIAVDGSVGPTQGTAYVIDDEVAMDTPTPDVWAFGPLSYGELPIPTTGTASEIGAGKATLNGAVNPRGFEVEECAFEWGEAGKPYKPKEVCAETPVQIGHGDQPVPVHLEITGIASETTRYHFRLIARNKYGESEGEEAIFGPPGLRPESAIALYDEAVLHAEIEPAGLATEYHFEYVTRAQFEANGFDEARSTPTRDLAPGTAFVAVQAALAGLTEGATYRYRIVAENEAATVRGPGRAFTTLVRRGAESCPNAEYRTGASADLPDCRAYELVSPAETAGLSPLDHAEAGAKFNDWLTVPRGEAAGDRLSFFTKGTIPGFEGEGEVDGYRVERGAGKHPAVGWTTTFSGPNYVESGGSAPVPEGLAADQMYSAWQIPEEAEDLEGVLPFGSNLRSPGQTAGSSCNVQPLQSDFESVGCGALGTDPEAEIDYIGSGGTRIVFSSKEALEVEPGNEAAPKGTKAIYEREVGSAQASVLSLKPDGGSFGAGENAIFLAATEDGGAVVFKVNEGVNDNGLFVRRGGQTSKIATSPYTFAGISQDGGRVFYGDVHYIEGKSVPAGLWVCDLETGPCSGPGAHAPTEVGPPGSQGIFVSVSPDGSHVLFTSEEALTGSEENENCEEPTPGSRVCEKAEAGRHNLYAWDGATTRFVGILDGSDLVSFQGLTDVNLSRWHLSASEEKHGSGGAGERATSPTRSTPNGEIFLFQSHAKLTEYDNEGVAEVYRYAPSAEAGERLLCLSCNPTGASPGGEATLQDLRPYKPASARSTLIPNATEDGQEIFFQSPDRLLPEDANKAQDVYEWKANGAGGCARSGGCLALISSGQGEGDSYLYSMTPSGRDVFFWTEEKLVPGDAGASRSIYDARELGGIPEPASSPPCQGDACQGQGSQSPSLSIPATTGAGDGNASTGRRPCGRHRHRVHGRCVSHHHHRHRHHRRAKRKRGAPR